MAVEIVGHGGQGLVYHKRRPVYEGYEPIFIDLEGIAQMYPNVAKYTVI